MLSGCMAAAGGAATSLSTCSGCAAGAGLLEESRVSVEGMASQRAISAAISAP